MAPPSDAPQGRPSIYDVARRAGVSHMTVSRVLNEHPNIRPATRERVLQAIDELGYRRSTIARALATKRTMRIGVLVDANMEYGPSATLRALEAAARQSGYSVTTVSIDDVDSDVSGAVDFVTQGVDAFCVIAPRESSVAMLRTLNGRPPALVITSDPEESMHTVGVDQRAGTRLAMEHLIALGHRRILHLTGPLDWVDARAREQQWHASLTAAGLPIPTPAEGDWSADSGYEVGLHHPGIDDATAVFASNDQMALGLLHGLRERGLRVPADISVVGFDDIADARHYCPPLTTVRQDFAALGSTAMAQLEQAISSGGSITHHTIPTELVVRASTAPAPSGR